MFVLSKKEGIMSNRSARISVGIEPEMLDKIRERAREVGISPNAWMAIRLGEAVRAQEKVSAAMTAMGHDLASMIAGVENAD